MQQRRNFIHVNESFTCQNCQTENTAGQGNIRNHCQDCLFSLHVDDQIPGDRLSDCHGLMEPIKSSQSGKKGWIIHHKCQKCGKEITNKLADDDNWDIVINLANRC